MASSDRKLTEWLGLERTFKDHLVQAPGHGQGHLSLDQVAQSPRRPGLEHFQGWGIPNLSGQPAPGSHHPHDQRQFPRPAFVCPGPSPSRRPWARTPRTGVLPGLGRPGGDRGVQTQLPKYQIRERRKHFYFLVTFLFYWLFKNFLLPSLEKN